MSFQRSLTGESSIYANVILNTNISADSVSTTNLSATNASFTNLTTNTFTYGNISTPNVIATNGYFSNLYISTQTVSVLNANTANYTSLYSSNASITNLSTSYINASTVTAYITNTSTQNVCLVATSTIYSTYGYMSNLSVSNLDVKIINMSNGYASNFSSTNSSIAVDESIGGALLFAQGQGGVTLSEMYGDNGGKAIYYNILYSTVNKHRFQHLNQDLMIISTSQISLYQPLYCSTGYISTISTSTLSVSNLNVCGNYSTSMRNNGLVLRNFSVNPTTNYMSDPTLLSLNYTYMNFGVSTEIAGLTLKASETEAIIDTHVNIPFTLTHNSVSTLQHIRNSATDRRWIFYSNICNACGTYLSSAYISNLSASNASISGRLSVSNISATSISATGRINADNLRTVNDVIATANVSGVNVYGGGMYCSNFYCSVQVNTSQVSSNSISCVSTYASNASFLNTSVGTMTFTTGSGTTLNSSTGNFSTLNASTLTPQNISVTNISVTGIASVSLLTTSRLNFCKGSTYYGQIDVGSTLIYNLDGTNSTLATFSIGGNAKMAYNTNSVSFYTSIYGSNLNFTNSNISTVNSSNNNTSNLSAINVSIDNLTLSSGFTVDNETVNQELSILDSLTYRSGTGSGTLAGTMYRDTNTSYIALQINDTTKYFGYSFQNSTGTNIATVNVNSSRLSVSNISTTTLTSTNVSSTNISTSTILGSTINVSASTINSCGTLNVSVLNCSSSNVVAYIPPNANFSTINVCSITAVYINPSYVSNTINCSVGTSYMTLFANTSNTSVTGIRLPNYIDAIDTGSGMTIGANQTAGFINVCRATRFYANILTNGNINGINATDSIVFGNNITSGGIQIGNTGYTNNISIIGASGVNISSVSLNISSSIVTLNTNIFRYVPWVASYNGSSISTIVSGSTTNPTCGTNSIVTYRYSIMGNSMFINFYLYQSNAGTSGSGYYQYVIPAIATYYIDSTYIQSSTNGNANGTRLGTCSMKAFGGSNEIGSVFVIGSGAGARLILQLEAGNSGVSTYEQQRSSYFAYGNSSFLVTFEAIIPILP